MDTSAYITTSELFWIVQAIPESAVSDTVTISILRLSDSYYWNFTSKLFASASASGNMTFVTDILWKQSFTPDIDDTYVLTINDTTLDVKYVQYLKAIGGVSSPTTTHQASKTNVANLALTEIGAKAISIFGETTTNEGRLISRWYDMMRDEVLCEHPWSFATKRYTLPLIDATPTMTEDGMRYVYGLPSDFLKMIAISDFGATYKIESGAPYGVSLVLLSDTLSLKIKYIYRNDDPTTYFPKFTTALASRLAAKICFNLTESASKARDMHKQYQSVDLPSACSEDSKQSTPDQVIQNEWENARFGSAGAVMAQPGSQTWHYVF